MFKKLKDKLAEEVKSSPQRIQQFAQAAQAAVTSASSSISDITNNDLFSIGDNDNQQSRSIKTPGQASSNLTQSAFQDVTLIPPETSQSNANTVELASNNDIIDNQRQRRLSNSSFASDVSFRLPSYESPSMYHLQSDMEISASEAEERGFSNSTVSLDRVTKEQLYSAYKRTQERYAKYRTQYADLARHYKLLERENGKARSVLVETQDKALRRISELREQCSLEQSAKAHLESALRIEIEEKNMKIDTLNNKIQLLQSNSEDHDNDVKNKNLNENDNEGQLIDISNDNDKNMTTTNEQNKTEIGVLNNKIEKMELLISKYKESLKTSKEKNTQLTTEIQTLSTEIDNKNKENEQLKLTAVHLTDAREKIQELNEINEELQNKINSYDFSKTKKMTTLEDDLRTAQEEITKLQGKIEVFTKREEENAISLAENKLSIHKELESKEAEIKSLKDSLATCKQEIQSLNIVLGDYKNNISTLEEERSKLLQNSNELQLTKSKIKDLENQLNELMQKCQSLEQNKAKADEEYKCLLLQHKQETAEKLAMIDRNAYLENKNKQLMEDTEKKYNTINNLEKDLNKLRRDSKSVLDQDSSERDKLLEELETWKNKYGKLESEMQEEREELVKLQSEIEKLLENHESIQNQNAELIEEVTELKLENEKLQNEVSNIDNIKKVCNLLNDKMKELKQTLCLISDEAKSLKELNKELIPSMKDKIIVALHGVTCESDNDIIKVECEELRKQVTGAQNELQITKDECKAQSNKITTLESEKQELKALVQELEVDKKGLEDKIQSFYGIQEDTKQEIITLKNEIKTLTDSKNRLEKQYQDIQINAKRDDNENYMLNEKLTKLVEENKILEGKLKEHSSKRHSLEEKISDMTKEHKLITEQLDHLKSENDKLNDLLNESNNKQKHLHDVQNKMVSLKDQHDSNLAELEILKNENQSLKNIGGQTKEKNEKLQEQIVQLNEQNKDIVKELEALKLENDKLLDSMKIYEEDKLKMDKLQENIAFLKSEHAIKGKEVDSLKQENESLKDKCKTYDELKVTIKNVKQDNSSLKTLNDTNANIVKDLKNELTETKKLLAQVDIEKNNLAANIESLKGKEREVSEKWQTLHNDYDSLKEENKRLQSDIEGLQTYLTNISKENSSLNDKLRELIASSDNSPQESGVVSPEFVELQNEIQTAKEKIDDLSRENIILVEENLELKDQLENYNNTHDEMKNDNQNNAELNSLQEKYLKLLETKNKLESQLSDLEVMNSSASGNMQQLQANNEKLRLSNEKLERRLDEALVSLRHLHSLEENTELEYLRNILYEYLTGPGTHSLTLAKVLAAVVKFDPKQTNLVLQKEKERQSLFGQLGLM